MRNVIKYFYNIDLDNIRMIGDNFYFVYRENKFVLYQVNDRYIDYQLTNSLNSLLIKNSNNFFQIVPNKDNSLITMYRDKKYILMMENFAHDRDFDYLDILETNIVADNNKTKNNWDNLWKVKVDYFEMFVENNLNKYEQLNKYYNYFIGMAENAIAYYKNAKELETKNLNDKSVISHKRIEKNYTFKDLYNPLFLIIDHPSRDLAEYLKMLFWNNKYNRNILLNCLNNTKLSNFGAYVLLARMMYPSFFFDNFEKLINNQVNVDEIYKIVNRMEEYEQYLLEIYKILKKQYNISQLEWIKKIDYSSTLTTPKTSGTSFISIDSMPSLSVTSIILQ